MSHTTASSFKPIAAVVSNILNWVCPECGGRMGGKGLEFKCQGRCQTDWRELWNCIVSQSYIPADYIRTPLGKNHALEINLRMNIPLL
jgi:tRNA(Ile2) C34 agmatinyltransferase TiaS